SYFGSFGVVCHDFEGRELWRHRLPVMLSTGQYGTSNSPVIIGRTVVLNRDQFRESSVLALDLETGKKVWETARPDSVGGVGTPVHWRNGGVDEVGLAATGKLKGYDLKTGRERWLVDGICAYVCTTPIVGEGMLYFAAWTEGQSDSPIPPWEDFLKRHDKNGD